MEDNTIEDFLNLCGIGSPGECWQWHGFVTRYGYGVFNMHYRQYMAHRIAYEHWVGSIPDGLTIDHLCRNKLCVNPSHLEVVSRGENSRRGNAERAARTHCPRGHEYTPANTRIARDGSRVCRACARDWATAHRTHHPKQLLTHCLKGHPFTPENTYLDPDGYRECRICRRARARAWYAANKLGAA